VTGGLQVICTAVAVSSQASSNEDNMGYTYSACRVTGTFMWKLEGNEQRGVPNRSADQYNETNVMHFLFNLLRINGLYMFRALLAHPQEAPHKRHLVYCVRVVSVGFTRVKVEL
jgi:hypothetical protein